MIINKPYSQYLELSDTRSREKQLASTKKSSQKKLKKQKAVAD